MNKLVHLEDVIEVVRKCSVKEVTPAYMLIDKAEVMAELMMLSPAQPEKDIGIKGWICPVCGRGLAPYVPYCHCADKWKIS